MPFLLLAWAISGEAKQPNFIDNLSCHDDPLASPKTKKINLHVIRHAFLPSMQNSPTLLNPKRKS
jgi:hypothetical protein